MLIPRYPQGARGVEGATPVMAGAGGAALSVSTQAQPAPEQSIPQIISKIAPSEIPTPMPGFNLPALVFAKPSLKLGAIRIVLVFEFLVETAACVPIHPYIVLHNSKQ
jgi:hypothetical protein